jgi:2-amino-4-hydroxy-6-hydroxymethyldihydropteridine diphosphokinase
VISTPDLTVPHERMGERRFVLEPLSELAPELRHPKTGKTIREMLAAVANQRIQLFVPQ